MNRNRNESEIETIIMKHLLRTFQIVGGWQKHQSERSTFGSVHGLPGVLDGATIEYRTLLKMFLALVLNMLQLTSNGSNLNSKDISNNNIEKNFRQMDSIPFKNKSLLNVNSYFIFLGQNLEQEFTRPFHFKKKSWENFGKYAVITVALSFADEPVQQAALKLRNKNTGINNLSKDLSDFGGIYEVLTVAGLGTYGLISSNNKLVNTTLLTSQAYITSGAMMTFLKILSGRTRPSYYPAGVEAEPRFLGPFHRKLNDANGSNENSSFPSGHSTVAFAVATVFASEYKEIPVVPVIAYSAASLISISRITENKHWITDVFSGAALGYFSGKLVVKNYHLFQKLSSSEKEKNSISFSVCYNWNHIEPALLYQFR